MCYCALFDLPFEKRLDVSESAVEVVVDRGQAWTFRSTLREEAWPHRARDVKIP